MDKSRKKWIAGLCALALLASGCTPASTDEKTQEETTQEEKTQEETSQDETSGQGSPAEQTNAQTEGEMPERAFRVESEVLAYDSAYLEVSMEVPVVKRGDAIDTNATRVLQKPFRDAVNYELTHSDMYAVRNEDYDKHTLTGGYKVVYEDAFVYVVAPEPELNYITHIAAVNKETGEALQYSALPKDEAFWMQVNNFLYEAGIQEVTKQSRQNILGSYYIAGDQLVFSIPSWYTATEGRTKIEMPLDALGLEARDLLSEHSPLYQIGSKQHRKSLPYYTLAGQIPVIESASAPEAAAALSAHFMEQVVMSEQLMEDDAKDTYESNKDSGYTFPPDIHNVQFDVMRNDSQYLSFYLMYYTYTGGAHGMHNDLAYTFDAQSGERIALKDLFKADTDYVSLLNEKIREEIETIAMDNEAIQGEYYNPYNGFESIAEDQHFYLTDSSLVLFFDLYEIAPYAAGIPMFEIPLKDLEPMLNEEVL